MSADHVELLVVFGKKENCVKDSNDFQKSFWCSLVSKPWCGTLLKALDIAKETPLTWNPNQTIYIFRG